jgi:hypothetical protein
MLTAFLKSPAEERCVCQISKFADRIQLGEITKVSRPTKILRYFIISVDKYSSIPLQELHMLIPRQGIENIIDTTYTFLNKEHHTPFELKKQVFC